MKKRKIIYFYFAALACKISGSAENINYILKSYKKSSFARFVSIKLPKGANLTATLLVKTIKSPKKTSNKEFFELESNPKKLEFKLACSENTFFVFPVIEQVLRKMFYIMFFKDNGFILHASAVAKGDDAYIFVGPAESGKSTIANLLAKSKGLEVFADNNVYIKREGKEFFAYKGPFLEWNVWFSNLLNLNEKLKIKKVFVLKKSKKTQIDSLSFEGAVFYIARQIQIPIASLNKNEIEKSRRLVFDFIQDGVVKKKIYLLSFKKDDVVGLKKAIY